MSIQEINSGRIDNQNGNDPSAVEQVTLIVRVALRAICSPMTLFGKNSPFKWIVDNLTQPDSPSKASIAPKLVKESTNPFFKDVKWSIEQCCSDQVISKGIEKCLYLFFKDLKWLIEQHCSDQVISKGIEKCTNLDFKDVKYLIEQGCSDQVIMKGIEKCPYILFDYQLYFKDVKCLIELDCSDQVIMKGLEKCASLYFQDSDAMNFQDMKWLIDQGCSNQVIMKGLETCNHFIFRDLKWSIEQNFPDTVILEMMKRFPGETLDVIWALNRGCSKKIIDSMFEKRGIDSDVLKAMEAPNSGTLIDIVPKVNNNDFFTEISAVDYDNFGTLKKLPLNVFYNKVVQALPLFSLYKALFVSELWNSIASREIQKRNDPEEVARRQREHQKAVREKKEMQRQHLETR